MAANDGERLVVLRAVGAIRRSPHLYFQDGVPTMEELISMVMRDVAGIPRITAEIVREGDFAAVSADVDWMVIERASFEHLFESFVIPTPIRVNSHRAEVLIAAVADGILTQGVAGGFAKGLSIHEVPSRLANTLDKGARTLIWRFSGTSWSRRQSAGFPSKEE